MHYQPHPIVEIRYSFIPHNDNDNNYDEDDD